MFTKDTQGNLYMIEQSLFLSNENYDTYFLTPIDTDLEFLSTHITVFKDESLDEVLVTYDYTISVKNIF